ncbi:MAG: zf-HC2 domain-containing protein [Actinomycetota bacterium]|nr:zf-HC2 domain-containing protein [Actinomycetota bacterium]
MDGMTPPEERHRYQEQIGAFVLGKLDGGELSAMQTHLSGCPVCQAEVRELEPVVAALADAAPDRIGEDPRPAGDLEELTLAPILGKIYRARRRRGRFQWSALAAAAICVVVIGLAGFTWLLEPAFTLELREDAVRLEVRIPGGDLVFSAKLTGASAEKSDPADTQKKPKPASSGGETPPKERSPESDPKRSPPGGASSASPDPDAAPGAGGQESVPPDAGQESVPPDAGQESASPAPEKQAAPASASPAADQYYAQP